MVKTLSNKITSTKNRLFNYITCKQCGVTVEAKKEDGDHLVEVLGTIIIAIVVLFIFRDQIVALFTKMMNGVSNSADSLFNKGIAAPVH